MRQSTSISYFEQLKTIFWLFWLTHVFLPISFHFTSLVILSVPLWLCVCVCVCAVVSHRSLYLLFAYSFDFVFGHSSTNNKILLKIYEKNSFAKRWNLYPSQANKQTKNAKISTENYTKIRKGQSKVDRRRSKLCQSQNSHASATIELTYNLEQ